MKEVWVRGAAMTPFGKHTDRSARDLVEEAVAGALSHAELQPSEVQFVYVANALAGSISGQDCMRAQTVLRKTGLMGVPMVAVENADCSGSTALHLAWQAVAHDVHDCVLVVGYEKFDHTDRQRSYRALNSAMDVSELADVFGPESDSDRSISCSSMASIRGATVRTSSGRFRWRRSRSRTTTTPR
jgi:acetyl-CoA acyltransferase